MKNFRHYLKMLLVVLTFAIPVSVLGQTQISDENGLKAIANNLEGDYILTSDITLTGDWTPIGDDTNRFKGTIDGNGKTIRGLKFKNSSQNGAGFIGVSEGALIKNLRLVGAQIYGGQDVGGIVGRAYAPTTIEGCFTSGIVSGYDHVGGIIGGSKAADGGTDYSQIQNCYSTAAVISTSWQAGGIIGTSEEIDITNTYYAGVATCPSGRTAGIVALADGENTSLSNSVVVSPFLKGDEANRVMGSENGRMVTLNNNYSWENTKVYVKGELYEDGVSGADQIDGEHTDEATLKSTAFYKNTLSWEESVWKIENGKYPVFLNQSYPIDGDAVYLATFPDRALPGNTFETNAVSALGRTLTMSSSDPTVATIDAAGKIAFLKNGKTTLTFQSQGDTYANGATLTYELEVAGISYTITTEEDLRNMKYDLEGEFTLANNITLTKDWTPIGTFKGTLNGNGKIIYGLTVNDKENRNKGLFSETEGATITKLGIEKARIVGNEDVGAIVGNMKGGLIDQSYVANSYIEGRDHVGSLVGAMRTYEVVVTPGDPDEGIEEVKEKKYAKVSNSYAAAHVYSREYQAGGVVGIINGGTIEKCYFSGEVESAKGRVGGIVALVDSDDSGAIQDNINLAVSGYCGEENYRIADWGGRVPSGENGYVKFINNWSKEQSYFGSDLKNSAVKDNQNNAADREGATLSSDNNARQESFYTGTLGWDLTNTWKFVAGTSGKMYPVLKWQEAPVTSIVYGIPEPAYLTWYPGSMEAIELNKIIASGGQDLTFDITAGSQFVEKDGNLLYVTESNLTQAGIAELTLNMDQSLSSSVSLQNSKVEIEIILRDAYIDVSSVEDFLAINNKLFAKFRLTKNINMTGIDFSGIGSHSTPFTGELNGNGFSIISPVVKTNGDNKKGLFNATNGAKIQKLGVVNFSFSGSASSGSGSVDLGGLVGSCKNTTIDECYLTGKVLGRDHVGGFVGGDCDNVTIKNSYVDATIQTSTQAGGFFGVTAGTVTVENSYFAGEVITGTNGWAGGIIGLIDKQGEIKMSNTVSIGNVSSERAGAHIGGNMTDSDVPRGTVSLFMNNLYNLDAVINTNGQEWAPIEVAGSVEAALPKYPADLKKQATYSAIGWDFASVWTIEEGVGYPTLKEVPVASGITSDENDATRFSVYTNGSDVIISGIQDQATVAVYNLQGQLVYKTVVSDNSPVSIGYQGLYILRIAENDRVQVEKVILK